MSFKAWKHLADANPDVSNAAFRVLFCLCNAHNSGKPSDEACFPETEALMDAAKIARSPMFRALRELEESGWILRKGATVPGQRTRRTYYILWFDDVGFGRALADQNTLEGTLIDHKPAQQSPREETDEDRQSPSSETNKVPYRALPYKADPVIEQVNKDPPGSPPGKSEPDQGNEDLPLDLAPPKKVRMTDDWSLTEAMRQFARSKQLTDQEIEELADDFRTYWSDRTDKNGRKTPRGWEQTWRNRVTDRLSVILRNRRAAGGQNPGRDRRPSGFVGAAMRAYGEADH